MSEDSTYRKMLEGKITSKRYAQELKKEVRRERNAASDRYLRSARRRATTA